MKYDTKVVKMAAQGRWKEIFLALAPLLSKAIEKPGQHVPCPVHGGVDGFRLFPNYEERGSGICNTCGARDDGFAMLMWVNRMSFREAVQAVGDLLLGQTVATKPLQAVKVAKRVSGELLDARKVPFNYDVRNGMSFRVKLRTESGAIETLWGKDLERAVSEFKNGQWIKLARVASQVVSTQGGQHEKFVWYAKQTETPTERDERLAREAEQNAREAAQKREAILSVWNAALPLTDPQSEPAMRYLSSRKIKPKSSIDALRFHPSLPYYGSDKKLVGHFPCLVAKVTNADNEMISVHRTFLTADGKKAPVEKVKKMMRVPNDVKFEGATIQLCPCHQVLGIAEGIETALSVMRLYRIPCWSVISDNGVRGFVMPEGVTELHVFADKDRSGAGQEAAKALDEAMKAKGITLHIHFPEEPIPDGAKGVDFNDVLQHCPAIKP